MPTQIQNRRQPRPSRLASIVAALSSFALIAIAACTNLADAVSGEPDGVSAELREAPCPTEPDYTAEELAALAMSPGVQQHVKPFGNAPAPDRQLHVTMSDGVKIAVSLYFPASFDFTRGRAPTAYNETWYTRAEESTATAIDLYRTGGFVVAIADPRGFGASFGSQSGYLTEAQRRDQREVIAWLASQPWSNGQVAAFGISVSGMLAEAMLASGAPSLKAGIVRATEFDQYSQNLFPGGIPNQRIHELIGLVFGMIRGEPCLADLAACPEVQLGAVDGDTDYRILQAALRDHQQNLAPDTIRSVTYLDDAVGSNTFADVSPNGSALEALRSAAVPARIGVSWLDGATAEGALARYNALQGAPMQVSIGATTHLGGLAADPFARDAFTPADAPAPVQWFSEDVAFLKRALAGESIARGVEYYVLGAGVWKTTVQWPPRGVTEHTLHLSDSRLSRVPGGAGEREYTVDPTTASGAAYNRWASGSNQPVYYGDRRFATGERASFDAAVQRADTELVGAAELCLAMRSDQTDGMVIAYLEDVAPDGRVTYLTEGELRLLHRKTATGGCDAAPGTQRSWKRADGAPVTPGELMHVEIPLLPVAARIAKGHHLRLSLAGADAGTFPALTEAPAKWSIAYGGQSGSTLRVPMKPWSASR